MNAYIFVVAENFLSSLTSPNGRPNFSSLTYFVQMEESGTRKVYRFANGFKYLNFSDVQSKLHYQQQKVTVGD